jgi:hypothetical protein
VSQWTAPDFRVTDVDGIEMVNVDAHLAFSAWTLRCSISARATSCATWRCSTASPVAPEFGLGAAAVSLSGFLVPAGFSARMTAFTYRGRHRLHRRPAAFNGQL